MTATSDPRSTGRRRRGGGAARLVGVVALGGVALGGVVLAGSSAETFSRPAAIPAAFPAAPPAIETGGSTTSVAVAADDAVTMTPTGNDPNLLTVDASPVAASFVRFDLRDVGGTVGSAQLVLHTASGPDAASPVGGTVSSSTIVDWSTSVPWAQRPVANGRALGGLPPAVPGAVVVLDVTRAVRSGEQVTFVLESSSADGARYESGATNPALAPRLEVEIAPALAGRVVDAVALADSTLDEAAPFASLGAQDTIVVSAAPRRDVLLRLPALPATAVDPSLRVRSTTSPAGSSITLAIAWISGGSWDEAAVAWATAPELDATFRSVSGIVGADGWVSFDLAGLVDAREEVVLRVATPSGSVGFSSRERPDGAPRLTGVLTSTPVIDRPSRVWAVGDMSCAPGEASTSATCRMRPVSNLLVADPELDAFLALGDLQYPDGTLDRFLRGYDDDFGRLLERTIATPGNHEYGTPGAAGFFDYVGDRAHPDTAAVHGVDIGTNWRVVVLNSNCGAVSCAAGGWQEQWLRTELAASTRPCTLAIWHHPRFSSGTRTRTEPSVLPFWNALLDDRAELVLNGHDHFYERFMAQDAAGAASAGGLQQLIVGGGGRSLYAFGAPLPTSAVRSATFGALRLDLDELGWAWSYVVEDGTVLDQGAGACTP